MALFLLALVIMDPVSDKAFFWLALAGTCLASATQDIAVDGYTIDILEEKELGPANGIRSASYRVGMITAGGVLVMMSEGLGWGNVFLLAAALMAVLAVAVLVWPALHLPRPIVSAPLPLYGQWVSPIQILFQTPKIWMVVIFIMTFKIGEAMLIAMANPFWIDQGFTPKKIGLVVGTLGTLASIGGALLGGLLTARWGILKSLWVLGAFQAVASLGYMLAAFPSAPAFSIYFAAPLENLAIGMATAAFLTFLMRLCDKRYSATHYAFLSMLFGLGRSLAGVVGGYCASQMGYPAFFFFTFIVGMAPLLFISFFKPTLSWVSERKR